MEGRHREIRILKSVMPRKDMYNLCILSIVQHRQGLRESKGYLHGDIEPIQRRFLEMNLMTIIPPIIQFLS